MDVIALEVVATATINASVAITLENGPAQLLRDRAASALAITPRTNGLLLACLAYGLFSSLNSLNGQRDRLGRRAGCSHLANEGGYAHPDQCPVVRRR